MKIKYSTLLSAALMLSTTAMAAETWSSNNDWQLVFEDDFNGPTLDTHNWSRIDYVSFQAPAWRKYQSQDPELVEFGAKNGENAMTLWGKYGDYKTQNNQTQTQSTYACGGVYTLNTFSFQYGYVEVRARFDSVQGVWPAIWMMPKSGYSWPNGGEIDIMEHLNYEGSVYQTIHYSKANNGQDSGSANVHPYFKTGDKTQWHTYGMEWTPEAIIFYLDGAKTGTFSKPTDSSVYWPFDDPNNEFYLLIDQQIGGSWVENAGAGGIDTATLQNSGAAFDIDYVRVYSTENYNHLVPEPSTACLSLLALSALLMRRKK